MTPPRAEKAWDTDFSGGHADHIYSGTRLVGVINSTVDASDIVRQHNLFPQLVEAFVGKIRSVSLGKPTLEDVFIRVTGHGFKDEN